MKVLRATRPNAGVAVWYARKLQALIDEMSGSYQYWIKASWRADTPRLNQAQDAAPIDGLRRTMDRLGKHWASRFDKLSDELTKRFADKSINHTNATMQAALNDAGFSIQFKMTPQVREALSLVIADNVGLIKTIPQKYLAKVEQQVWNAVAAGSDLATLTKELQHSYGVTYKRAAFIARDQNAKAHAVIEAARRYDLGIRRAQWVHSGAGKEPRPSHVKAGRDKLEFDIDKGAFLDGVWTLPGHEINCRCTSRAIVDGWED